MVSDKNINKARIISIAEFIPNISDQPTAHLLIVNTRPKKTSPMKNNSNKGSSFVFFPNTR